MKQSSKLGGILAAALVTMIVPPAIADHSGQAKIAAELSGYQETPLTINSAGSGEFTATIHDNGTAITYQLTYRDLTTPVTQAHIHFGRPGITGAFVLFLCNTSAPPPPATVPTPPLCPPAPATVTGTLTAADVIAVPGQGIDSGATGFTQMLEAIRAGAAYANVHTTSHLGGEIRSCLHLLHHHDE